MPLAESGFRSGILNSVFRDLALGLVSAIPEPDPAKSKTLAGIEPGAAVLSEQANQQGPRLVQIVPGVLQSVGVKLDPSKVSASHANARGQKEPFLETQNVLGTQFVQVCERYGLNDVEAADAAAIATALLIKNCSQRLDPHAGFALAVYGFIEGTKTAPAVADSIQRGPRTGTAAACGASPRTPLPALLCAGQGVT